MFLLPQVTLGMSYNVENNWACAILRVQVTLYEQQVSASVEFIKEHKYTLTSICCAPLLKCYRHSGDAELRLGFGDRSEATLVSKYKEGTK